MKHYRSNEHDYEILMTYMRHARVMLDILAVGATARTWKAKHGWELPPTVLDGLRNIGPMIDPTSHFENQNYGNPEP